MSDTPDYLKTNTEWVFPAEHDDEVVWYDPEDWHAVHGTIVDEPENDESGEES